MRGAYLDVFAGVGYRLAYLVVHAGGGKIGERAGERYLSADGKSRRHTYHVGFGYTCLEKPFRVGLDELVHFERAYQVRTQGHYIGVFIAQFGQSVAESAAGIVITQYFVFFHHFF